MDDPSRQLRITKKIRQILNNTHMMIWFVRENNIAGDRLECDKFAARVQQNVDMLRAFTDALLADPVPDIDLKTQYPPLPPHLPIHHAVAQLDRPVRGPGQPPSCSDPPCKPGPIDLDTLLNPIPAAFCLNTQPWNAAEPMARWTPKLPSGSALSFSNAPCEPDTVLNPGLVAFRNADAPMVRWNPMLPSVLASSSSNAPGESDPKVVDCYNTVLNPELMAFCQNTEPWNAAAPIVGWNPTLPSGSALSFSNAPCEPDPKVVDRAALSFSITPYEPDLKVVDRCNTVLNPGPKAVDPAVKTRRLVPGPHSASSSSNVPPCEADPLNLVQFKTRLSLGPMSSGSNGHLRVNPIETNQDVFPQYAAVQSAPRDQVLSVPMQQPQIQPEVNRGYYNALISGNSNGNGNGNSKAKDQGKSDHNELRSNGNGKSKNEGQGKSDPNELRGNNGKSKAESQGKSDRNELRGNGHYPNRGNGHYQNCKGS